MRGPDVPPRSARYAPVVLPWQHAIARRSTGAEGQQRRGWGHFSRPQGATASDPRRAVEHRADRPHLDLRERCRPRGICQRLPFPGPQSCSDVSVRPGGRLRSWRRASCWLPRNGNGPGDAIRRRLDRLVLPNSHDRPAGLGEPAVGVPVTRSGALDLRPPPLGVGNRPRRVLGAAVPEATVDEDRHARAPEDQIGSTTQVRQRLTVYAVTKSASEQFGAEPQLSGSVSPPHLPHARRRFGG